MTQHDKPECIECGETYHPKRKALGYNTCLTCGEEAAREARMGWCIVPTPKGHYTRVTRKEELKHLNQKVR
jgi:ribosomal protein L37AE/L43A